MCDFNSGMMHKTLCLCILWQELTLCVFPKESMTPKRLGNTALTAFGSFQSSALCFLCSWFQVISIFCVSSCPKIYGCILSKHPHEKEPCSCIQLAVRLSILLSIHPCMHASIYPLIHLSTPACIHVSIHSSIYPPMQICIHPSIYLSIHPCIHPLSNLFTHPFIHPIIHPHPSIHSPIHPSVHLLTHSSYHPPHSCNHPFSPLCWAPASKKEKVYLLPSMVLHFSLKMQVYTRGQCDPINLAMQDGSCCVSITHLDCYFWFQFIMVVKHIPSLISRSVTSLSRPWGGGF